MIRRIFIMSSNCLALLVAYQISAEPEEYGSFQHHF